MCQVASKIGLLSEVKTIEVIEIEVSYPIEEIESDRKAKCVGRGTIRGDEGGAINGE